MFGDRRRMLMSGGGVALLLLAIWSWWPATPPQAAPAARRGAAAVSKTTPAPVAPVKLDALAAERHAPSDDTRNPFRYQARVAPPPVRSAEPPRPVMTEAPRPAAPAGPPPIPLKFIGLLERANGVKWAVLSDGKVTMHGREGDIIDGRYRIVKIGTESVELAYADGSGRQVVKLTGQ